MRTIHKYLLTYEEEAYGHQAVQLPRSSLILDIGLQSNGIYVWAVVDPEDKTTYKKKYFIGWTGQDLPLLPQIWSFEKMLIGESLVHQVFTIPNQNPGV